MRRTWMVLAMVVGCAPEDGDDPSTFRITDQSGAEFLWTCTGDKDRDCVHRIAGVSPPLPTCDEGEVPGYSYRWGRFLQIFSYCDNDPDDDGWLFQPWYRAVVCEEDIDCPQELPKKVYECRAGFCQRAERDPAELPIRFDLIILCNGDEPRSETIEPLSVSPEVEAVCPDHDPGLYFLQYCEDVPAGCPDPRE
ncbi:MAG: hypothetical protein IAG13_37570 [Deltaproteobacteria bacterium]|nr:hypothetical protein [Nannocystaceae bacterium]